MLGQHPELAGLPELKLFCYSTLAELETSLPDYWRRRGVTHRSPGLLRAVALLLFGGQTAETLREARQWLEARSHWPGASILDVLLARLHPRSAVEKSPEHVLDDVTLERMAAAYPAARYVHLTRHPISTQRSMQEYRKRLAPTDPQIGEPMAGIESWYEVHRRILLFTASLPAVRHFRVRAEDVLNQSDGTLRAIAGWLGVRTDESAIEAMKHPELSPFADAGPPELGVAGGNDPGFLRDPVPRRASMPDELAPPTGWSAPTQVWTLVTEMSERLGYH